MGGTPAAPIWIGGAPGEDRPVIVGGSEGLRLTRGKYVVIHDIGSGGNEDCLKLSGLND